MRVLKKFPSIDIVVVVVIYIFPVLCSCGTCLPVCVVHGLQFENCFAAANCGTFVFQFSCGSAAVEDLPVNCMCQ